MTETNARDQITAALAHATRDNDDALTAEPVDDVAALVADLEQLQDDYQRRRALTELLQRRYPAAQVTELRQQIEQLRAAHRSAQKAYVRMETERDELRRAIATAAGHDPDLICTLDTDYLALLNTLTDRQTDGQTSGQTAR